MSGKNIWSGHFVCYWLPVYLWAGVIFFISSLSGLAVPATIKLFFEFQLDKIAHIFEYMVFAWLLRRGFESSYREGFRKHAIIYAILFGIVYGIGDEFHQYFVPGREVSITDVTMDSVGVILAQVIYKPQVISNYLRLLANNYRERSVKSG